MLKGEKLGVEALQQRPAALSASLARLPDCDPRWDGIK